VVRTVFLTPSGHRPSPTGNCSIPYQVVGWADRMPSTEGADIRIENVHACDVSRSIAHDLEHFMRALTGHLTLISLIRRDARRTHVHDEFVLNDPKLPEF
jgi:hypothetical protein